MLLTAIVMLAYKKRNNANFLFPDFESFVVNAYRALRLCSQSLLPTPVLTSQLYKSWLFMNSILLIMSKFAKDHCMQLL